MVNDGAAIDCNLQAMVCIVVLGGFIIRIKLQERKLLMLNVTTVAKTGLTYIQHGEKGNIYCICEERNIRVISP